MRVFRAFTLLPLCALLTLSPLTLADSDDDPNARAVKYRQAVLTVMGANIAPLVAMARGNIAYDAEAAAMRANRIHQMTLMMEEAFRRDTSGANNIDTEALDKIWDNWSDFQAKIDKVQKTSLALANTDGGADAFKAAFSDMGGSCKACHDEYRED